MANNLKVFDTIQDYENATIENNSVSYIKEDNSIRYSGGVEHTVQAPITSVKVNGESITTDADGNIDIGNVQEQLVSGTNIKTVNNQSILGGGNIEIVSGSNNDANVMAVDTSETLDDVSGSTYVKYTIQVLTDDQKQQARDNIGAMSADNDVSVDLSNYYTKSEIDSQIGDINSILESIIGEGSSLFPIILVEGDNGQKGIDLYNYIIANAESSGMSFNSGDVTWNGNEFTGALVISDLIRFNPSPSGYMGILLNSNGYLTCSLD